MIKRSTWRRRHGLPVDSSASDRREVEGVTLDSAAVRPTTHRTGILVVGALIILIGMAAIAVTQGAAPIPATTALRLLFSDLPFITAPRDIPDSWHTIIFDIRLPRIVAAGLVGSALAYSGASYQGVFRNPLAGPFLLGIASGAALAAAIAIVSPLTEDSAGIGWVPIFAFVGAIITVIIVYLLAQTGASVSNVTLILAGVALSAVFSAVTSFILLTGGEQARPIFAFLFGGFNSSSWTRVLVALPYLAVGAAVVMAYSRVLNVLQLDEQQAAQLGVDVKRTKLIILAGASLVAATAVAMAGVIGFVGLIVPHVVRMIFGGDHRRLLPLAAVVGAAFLIGADVIARTVLAPQEVPVGIVTAMIGGPFFLILLRTRRMDGA